MNTCQEDRIARRRAPHIGKSIRVRPHVRYWCLYIYRYDCVCAKTTCLCANPEPHCLCSMYLTYTLTKAGVAEPSHPYLRQRRSKSAQFHVRVRVCACVDSACVLHEVHAPLCTVARAAMLVHPLKHSSAAVFTLLQSSAVARRPLAPCTSSSYSPLEYVWLVHHCVRHS